MTKSQFTTKLAELSGLTLAQAKAAVDAFPETVLHFLNSEEQRCTLPGISTMTVINNPAKPERVGFNPFTGQEQTFKAKPAEHRVRTLVSPKFSNRTKR